MPNADDVPKMQCNFSTFVSTRWRRYLFHIQFIFVQNMYHIVFVSANKRIATIMTSFIHLAVMNISFVSIIFTSRRTWKHSVYLNRRNKKAVFSRWNITTSFLQPCKHVQVHIVKCKTAISWLYNSLDSLKSFQVKSFIKDRVCHVFWWRRYTRVSLTFIDHNVRAITSESKCNNHNIQRPYLLLSNVRYVNDRYKFSNGYYDVIICYS